ncbi:PBP1A family penicillin-binding protein [Castellaniella caeni]
MPSGLTRTDDDFYFAEFPPGVAVARVGLPAPGDELQSGTTGQPSDDGIGALLNQLHGQPVPPPPPPPQSGHEAAVPQPVRVPF